MAEPIEPSYQVVIGGRVFTLDAVYAGRRQAPCPSAPRPCARRLLDYEPAYPWPGGRVEVEVVPSATAGPLTRRQWLSGRAWLAWAGEEVPP